MTPVTTASAQSARTRYREFLLDHGYVLELDGPSGEYLRADDRSHVIWIGWVFPGGHVGRHGFRVEIIPANE